MDLDLETLMRMDVEVSVAARHEQRSSDAPAAVFVLTREDIRRSGAVSIPEVLRLVPGMQIRRLDNQRWSVSARGFGNVFANKMLVLIDGRSIYTSSFAGVIWEEQNMPLEEIERIEVVRGPGGALWGVNAVNGVVNIITKRAADSRGVRLTARSGDATPWALGGAFGGSSRLGDYRLYFDHFERDAIAHQFAPWQHKQVGGRLDRAMGSGELTLQGELSENDFSDYDGAAVGTPSHSRGGNVVGGWKGQALQGGELELHGYYAWTRRDEPGTWNDSALGLDVQWQAPRYGRHQPTVGFGIHHYIDDPRVILPVRFVPSEQDALQTGLYAQDEMYFLADRLRFTVGAKIENFSRTGTALQPTVRALWHASERHTFWTALSRAARAPSRQELDSELSGQINPTTAVIFHGNRNLDFEELTAYEMGWRWRPEQHLSVDATLFQHDYEELIGSIPSARVFNPGPPPQLLLISDTANFTSTRSRGADLNVEAALTDRFRLQGNVSFLDQHLPALLFGAANTDPKWSASLNARIGLPQGFSLDLTERFVGEPPNHSLDSYYNLDMRLAWQASQQLELSVRVDNVFDRNYLEPPAPRSPLIPQERRIYVRANWGWRP